MNNPTSNYNKHHFRNPFAIKQLDKFGCGECFDFFRIRNHKDINIKQYYGLDLSYKALQTARKLGKDQMLNLIQGDVLNLPIKSNRFDLILGLEILEHLKSPEEVLHILSTKYTCPFIFSVPNEPLFRLTRLILYRRDIRKLGNHPEHLHNWSKNQFSRLISQYFTIKKVSTISLWTIILCHQKDR